MSDFDGTPFVAGSVTAIRAFKVDTLGRLCSPQQKAIFTPGVNEAECGEAVRLYASVVASYNYARLRSIHPDLLTASRFVTSEQERITYTSADDLTAATTADRQAEEKAAKKAVEEAAEHVPGQMGCKCGFYAYYDETERNAWMGRDCVEAAVEATGRVTHGEKGIRAQKLRVVAMVDPTPPPPSLWRRFAGWMGDRIWAQALTTFMASAGVVVFFGALATASEGALPVALAALVLALLGSAGVASGFTSVPAVRVVNEMGDSAATRFELVKRNYPDVKVYRTRKAMLAAHPTTKPAPPVVPSPETDDNFWKMEAP